MRASVGKAVLLGMLASVLGCAAANQYPAPSSERVANAQMLVINAEAEAKGEDAQALELRREARRQYQEATLAMSQGDYRRAHHLLARAEADAELSIALARRAMWREQAQRADARLDAAYRQPARTTETP